ncbi:oxidoreductase [Amycolatopsis rhabdoformis]|uniref:Oxidoreductase n=1 Tax=Amycolatopsis rhabdoformis TaxID=1448059 RepID=A0ABZ1I5G4_9PSEU|nr:oxidoreductase [Amycolatopsis rhabdoformis]WSE29656.1 oxidoreductase [Amycolatopsis rhabdoformis]
MSARVWLITGASSGFGRALAAAALAAGDTVVAAVRRPEAVADLVAAEPGRVSVVELDVTDEARIEAAVAEVIERHGRIDVLVNNAGRGLVGAAEETTTDELRGLMDLHFFGPVALTRAVLPHLRAQGSGAIVQMSSQAGRFAFGGVSAYASTKFALEGWSEALAEEVAPFGVHVVIVEPGAFRTAFNEPGVLLFSEVGDVYREQLEPIRAALAGADGVQPGDPVKAAEAIVTALAAERPPLRLALGTDAADNVAASYERGQAVLAEWEKVSRGTDF